MSTFGTTPAFSFGQPASTTPAAAIPAPAAGFGGFGKYEVYILIMTKLVVARDIIL
jgi:hypothetical protein